MTKTTKSVTASRKKLHKRVDRVRRKLDRVSRSLGDEPAHDSQKRYIGKLDAASKQVTELCVLAAKLGDDIESEADYFIRVAR